MKQPLVRRGEKGVAIVTALLLTALTVMLVTSLFWQQQVQARSLENQRLRLQTQWLLRSTLDWARVMLREDTSSSSVDHLGERWARPLTATELDQYVQDSGANREMSGAVLSGTIVDAQSRFNLSNLVIDGKINSTAVDVLRRLCEKLDLNPGLAQGIADAIEAQWPHVEDTGTAATGPRYVRTDDRVMRIEYIEDLLAVPGLTPEMLAKLKNHVVILPVPTEVNVNTASALVLAARLGSSVEEAQELVASRDRIHLRDGADLVNRSNGKVKEDQAAALAFGTSYFLVNGKVKVRQSAVDTQALIERHLMAGPRVLWVRDN